MNKKNIYLKYKILDGTCNYNVEESLELEKEMSCKEIEEMLFDTHNKEIMLLSFSYNCY